MPPLRWIAGTALLPVCSLFACNAISGLDELQFDAAASAASGGSSVGGSGQGGTGADGVGGDGTGGMASECPSQTVCHERPPEGWSGPVSVVVNDEPAGSCAVGTLVTGGLGDPGEAFTCNDDCVCGPSNGEQCPSTADVTFYASEDATCSSGGITTTVGSSCTPIPASVRYGDFTSAAMTPTGGSCAPTGGGVSTAPPAFASWAHTCGFADDEAVPCAGGVCSPAGGGACIYRPGTFGACPPGTYGGTPIVMATDYEDSRDCSPCDCDPPAGGNCTGNFFRFYFNTGCLTQSGSGPISAPCTDNPSGSGVVSASLGGNTMLEPGSCAPTGGQAEGSVVVDEYVTLCCAD